MQAGIGYPIDELTYAEAVQIYCESGRDHWSHTASLAFYICEVHRDPKKGKKLTPTDYNPWEAERHTQKEKLTTANFTQLQHLAQWRKT